MRVELVKKLRNEEKYNDLETLTTAINNDAVAAKICRDIAKACEERLSYPGEIKVTVIRESRFTELAK